MSERMGGVQVRPDRFPCCGREIVVRDLEQRAWWYQGPREVRRPAADACVVLPGVLEGVFPAVGAVGHQRVQHGQRGALEPRGVLHRTEHRRHVREADLAQETTELELRMRAGLEAPVD